MDFEIGTQVFQQHYGIDSVLLEKFASDYWKSERIFFLWLGHGGVIRNEKFTILLYSPNCLKGFSSDTIKEGLLFSLLSSSGLCDLEIRMGGLPFVVVITLGDQV